MQANPRERLTICSSSILSLPKHSVRDLETLFASKVAILLRIADKYAMRAMHESCTLQAGSCSTWAPFRYENLLLLLLIEQAVSAERMSVSRSRSDWLRLKVVII